jgi:hypothetical protein
VDTSRLPVVLSVDDLRELTRCSTRKAYALAKKLGRKHGQIWLIPRVRFEGWLLSRAEAQQ